MSEEEKSHVSMAQETNNQGPFVIRAHHAAGIKPLITGEKSVEEMTEDTVKFVKEKTFPIGYTKDVLGTTPDQEQTFRVGADNIFKTFNELSPDHPIQIVADKKDGFCNSCAVGNHCDKKIQQVGDTEYIKTFVDKAIRKGLYDDINVTYENGTPSLATSKKTLDAIVQDMTALDNLHIQARTVSRYTREIFRKKH